MTLILGRSSLFWGNVTTLNWIGTKPAADIETSLGFGAGRLSAGFFVLLLKERLAPEDFEFDGTTLRSGGRMGLPGATTAADERRLRVHDGMIAEYGRDGYRRMQQRALESAVISGPQRIAKVLPKIPHNEEMAPSQQYPMGGGGLQWKILRPGKLFLVAMFVDQNGIATLPDRTIDIRQSAPYQNRHDAMRYLQQA